MFLHSGASLHGHEYTSPQSPHSQQRKKPFLRSALPAPILRSSTSTSLTDRHFSPSSAPKTSAVRRRPASDVYIRPMSGLLLTDDPPRASAPTSPVVRFKEPDVVDNTPATSSSFSSPPMADDEAPSSLYESDDASQATSSTPRRRRRRALPRSSTAYLLARPAPRPLSKKKLFKTIRPRLLLQLQELAPGQRPRPTVDVFPAALLARPLVAARHIHRCPRLFGAHGELGPRDLVMVRSEDYTASDDDDADEQDGDAGRQQPVAVLSPGRAPGDSGQVVLEDGSVWTWSSLKKGYHEFVHVDEHGATVTARWVRRSNGPSSSSNKRLSSGTAPWPGSPSALPSSPPATGEPVDPDYRYTFSIINPSARRHPILATLTPQSLEIYNDYTTPSSSSGRYPPTRPVSGTWDPAKDPPSSPLSFEEPPSRRETHRVDEETKNLIRVTGLWLAMRLGPALDLTTEAPATETPPPPQQQQDQALAGAPTPSLRSCATLPRRKTTPAVVSTPSPLQPKGGLRRAMSTGAAFMMQRKRRQQEHAYDAPSSDTALVAGKIAAMGSPREDDERRTCSPASAAAVSAGGPAAAAAAATKQARRVSWFKRLTH